MKNTVVVFESKYGATEKYAAWLAQELSCAAIPKKKVRIDSLASCQTLLYGGGLYAGGVAGIDFLTRNFTALSGKNLVLFTCGLADTNDPGNIRHIREALGKVLTPAMEEKIKIFHLRGAIDYARLQPVHKCMMAMLRRSMLRKDPAALRPEDREMLDTYGKAVDFTDKNAIAPILSYLRGL